jgi:hypothetical protein
MVSDIPAEVRIDVRSEADDLLLLKALNGLLQHLGEQSDPLES